jgi:hypothetical protein
MSARGKLLCWEIGCIVWIAMAGSLLHFAFELSEYWRPMAVMAAVNESAWEHTKMYFWPGLLFALVQYNYWFGKVVALALTPLLILVVYFSYLAYVDFSGIKPSLPVMLTIMITGIAAGQLASWRILCARPLHGITNSQVAAGYAVLVLAFSSLTYFPPRVFVFENFYCYQYTGEYGILDNYEPYRVFYKGERPGGGVNYCATLAQQATSANKRPSSPE